jgi:hypothetical protein
MKTILGVIFAAILLSACVTSNMTIDQLEAMGYEKADFPENNYSGSVGFTVDVKSALNTGAIYIGMAEKSLIELCYPDDVNISVGSWGEHKQFVYKYDNYERVYIYVENGEVVAWQL